MVSSSSHQILDSPVPVGSGNKFKSGRFYFVCFVIAITSWVVYYTNTVLLEHGRNFTRALHYHILGHQIMGVYWFGQEMNNYPIHQFYQVNVFRDFLLQLQDKMGNLHQISYGLVDQASLNTTQQTIVVMSKQGDIQSYYWTLSEGPKDHQPFRFDNIQQIKACLVESAAVHIDFATIDLGKQMRWNIQIVIEPFSDSSIIVTFVAKQQLSLSKYHYVPFACGIILGLFLLWEYVYHPKRRLQNFLYYFLSVFLTTTSILSFSEVIGFELIFMLDGVTCCSAWLCAINFYTKDEDYKLSFLLTKSYLMIGRLFASFGPLLIAFSLFAYCVFCRYAGQFSSFWRTFMSLFYICYYNMTYESAIVTSRANPISLIFFVVFVLLFTICIYSGMLVSVFCSYVWGKRQEQIKKDIINNLKIQCSSCDHKYKYTERAKIKPKKSFNLSQFLQIDFYDPEQCAKYKRVMIARVHRLRTEVDKLLEQSINIYKANNFSIEMSHKLREDMWIKTKFIDGMVGNS